MERGSSFLESWDDDVVSRCVERGAMAKMGNSPASRCAFCEMPCLPLMGNSVVSVDQSMLRTKRNPPTINMECTGLLGSTAPLLLTAPSTFATPLL